MCLSIQILLLLIFVTLVGLWIIVRTVWSRQGPRADLSLYPSPEFIRDKVTVPYDGNVRLFEPPLKTLGRNIVDKTGKRIKLVSVNWYGASDVLMIPGGLDLQNRSKIARTIRELGFNSVRLPYADEMVRKNPLIDPKLLGANDDLIGLRALDVYAGVVRALTEAGLAVVINNHITQARWCCDGNPCDMAWRNDNLGPLCPVRQTEEDWIENLVTVMKPHVENPRVVGIDLRNEVRGITGGLLWSSWATAAERASQRLHQLQPEWLMIVEGVQSANNLRGVKERPVQPTYPNKLVYSSHVYGWSGWGTLVPYWYRKFKSFAADMDKNWEYLRDGDIAPVWVGEIGAPNSPSERDYHYWKNLMKYMRKCDADFGYWAINPRKPGSNSHETYGLLRDDWETPVYDYRLLDMYELRPKETP